tara:strand:+ start:191 stop:424 length:234 start_codon:yes stop_codon:yes gene_type:complete
MNKELINYLNKYKTDTIPNNFSVQIYDKKTDNKLDILYINNIINLDIDDENFNERFEKELLNDELTYNINDIYYSIL